jgi:transcriptional regulator with XRE-family HTH domain
MKQDILQELLTNLRAGAQLTQKQLSKQLNRPQSYVSKYESGERKLTLMEIRSIAICCGSNLEDFVSSFEEELKLIER